MPFPSPPWHLTGDLWFSLFPVTSGTTDRPAGLYAAAFADYAEAGDLAYQELLVARVVRDGRMPRLTITDIWVNSPASRDGGRALWAIPKQLADISVLGRRRLASRSTCHAAVAEGTLASARFTGPAAPALRLPYRLSTLQAHEDGAPVITPISASARTLPVLARWEFDEQGPLAWLRGRRPSLSFHVSDARLTFGG